jgi:predicted AAA+ superfamily ATPase
MEYFLNTHKHLVKESADLIRRDLYDEIDWSHRLIGIKGVRGVGKTTFLLDYVRREYGDSVECLYVNLNNFYFTKRRIFSFADEFYKRGGKVLILDQVHKYPEWSIDLRECYDQLQGLQIIFSSSPVLRVIEGNDDLKDIAKIYHLEGLSFREYLNYKTSGNFQKVSFQDIIAHHSEIVPEILAKVRPLAYFPEYLKTGYYPYFINSNVFYNETLLKHINLALEIDVTYLNQIELKYLSKLRKLLQLVAGQMPFSPNVSRLSNEVEASRATVLNYIRYLKNARLINLLFKDDDSGQLKKPDLAYLHNTNLLYAIAPENVNNRNLRTTFFYNQVGHSNLVTSSDKFDFKVNGEYEFTVGGKYTKADGKNRFAAADMIETGDANTIPIWLFGFLY